VMNQDEINFFTESSTIIGLRRNTMEPMSASASNLSVNSKLKEHQRFLSNSSTLHKIVLNNQKNINKSIEQMDLQQNTSNGINAQQLPSERSDLIKKPFKQYRTSVAIEPQMNSSKINKQNEILKVLKF
jgi:hypothetical protein